MSRTCLPILPRELIEKILSYLGIDELKAVLMATNMFPDSKYVLMILPIDKFDEELRELRINHEITATLPLRTLNNAYCEFKSFGIRMVLCHYEVSTWLKSRTAGVKYDVSLHGDIALKPKDLFVVTGMLRTGNTRITHLTLGGCEINNQGAVALADALEMAKVNLRILELGANKIGCEGAVALSRALTHCTSLISLDLQSNEIETVGIAAIMKLVSTPGNNIRHLNIVENRYGGGSGILIAKELKSPHSRLSKLLVGFRKDDVAVVAIFQALPYTRLLKLDLTAQNIGVKAATVIGRALSNANTKLEELKLRMDLRCLEEISKGMESGRCNLKMLSIENDLYYEAGFDPLSNKGAAALSRLIASGNSSLKQLKIINNNVHDEGALALAMVLKRKSELEVLNLGYNKITNQGARAFGSALESGNRTLKVLNLERNDIGVEGAQCIAQALKAGKCSLTTLDLGQNRIEAEGAKALAAALESGRTCLKHLNLFANSIGDVGMKAISKALKSGKSKLTELKLERNGIGYEGARSLAIALKHGNTELLRLHLCDNKIGDNGVFELANALSSGNTKLIDLSLYENDIGDDGAHSLAQALESGNTSLKELCLRNNRIGEEGAISIASALINFKSNMARLDISSNSIAIHRSKVFIKALQSVNIDCIF